MKHSRRTLRGAAVNTSLAVLSTSVLTLVSSMVIQKISAHEEPDAPTSGIGQFTPDTCTDPSRCGQVQPLTPFHGAEAVHSGLVWKTHGANPKLLYWARHSEYKGSDVVDPAVLDDLIDNRGALLDPANNFNDSLRPTFKKLVYGGFEIRQGLSQSVPTRILGELDHERLQLFDINHPNAFKNSGKFDTALLKSADFALNQAAFQDAGSSRGLNYNLYCSGHAALADGRIVTVGGHDMNSNNGLFKINIFDPETETWANRAKPCVKANWQRDRFGAKLFAADPNAPYYPGCNPLVITSTQPPDLSDMTYARWYPTGVILPNNTVLILGGTDQDATVGPDPKPNPADSDAAFHATKIHQVVPEIYDPKMDRTIQLENARKIFPVYPQAEVVQTGPGMNDWKVCVVGGEPAVISNHFDGPYRGRTYCLDVLGALRDTKREIPAENHWTFLDEAPEAHDYCCSTTSLVTLGEKGKLLSHKVAMFAGKDANRAPTKTVLMIDYAEPAPAWKRQSDLIQTAITHKSLALPDGKVFIGAGRDTTKVLYEERNSLRYQMFDPADGSIRVLAKTTVPRGLHGNASLLPDGTVLVMGEDRINLVPRGDRIVPQGDPDWGVANGQIYKPPYLFKKDGSPAERPVIVKAEEEMHYRRHFDIQVAGRSDRIGIVSMIRTDVNTQSLDTGNRYVRLWFRVKGNPAKGELRVHTPARPAQALAGHYMLFVVDNNGVPSIAKHVQLKFDDDDDDEREIDGE